MVFSGEEARIILWLMFYYKSLGNTKEVLPAAKIFQHVTILHGACFLGRVVCTQTYNQLSVHFACEFACYLQAKCRVNADNLLTKGDSGLVSASAPESFCITE